MKVEPSNLGFSFNFALILKTDWLIKNVSLFVSPNQQKNLVLDLVYRTFSNLLKLIYVVIKRNRIFYKKKLSSIWLRST